ncbi:protein SYM1 isoform X2 [Populus trichocarpa]|uniref:protein SYM1 isoform X2 n=1 Tax=Populus trichocarpa TaxID=3694 RepID=UPI000CCD338C|nr:protein SYM1 isoform X2 [Populus trichocarpa]XP_061975733.1 protein SYM1 isoform X2 [Populus nigra]|eukprot:XP_024466688.1 protein SYM1 isoform X2 [Populus trichocarpa]
MKAVSGGNGEFWGWKWEHKRRRIKQSKASKSSDSATGGGGGGYWFPLKQAVTAGALALTGDTVAQVTDRWKKNKPSKRHSYDQDASQNSNDNQTVKNLMLKVLLNQIVLGPSVIAVVFAWNNLWQGKLSQLPEKYQRDALPTLLYGFRFWIPVSVLNFWAVPIQARVAFMSTGSIFWNFCLSSTLNK